MLYFIYKTDVDYLRVVVIKAVFLEENVVPLTVNRVGKLAYCFLLCLNYTG